MSVRDQRVDRCQELLLKAALLPPERALEAWEELMETCNPDRLDPGAQRLLPQLFANLRAAGAEEQVLGGLRPAYRKTWVKNRVLLRVLAHLLGVFRGADIETLVLKGAALIPLVYRDYGCRPMGDLDVLVPRGRAAESIHLLRRLGWRSDLALPETLIGIRHADVFRDARGCRLDLHWSVLQECCRPGENDDFWHGSVPIEVEGVPTRALCSADQLLHVCVHGARSSAVQPLSWIADAMMILRSSTDVAWRRLLDQTHTRRLTVPMHTAFGYLHANLGATVPAQVLESLETARTSRFEHLEFRVKASRRELVGSLPVLWFDYWRVAEGQGFARRVLGFPRYLQRTFRVRTLWGLPMVMARLATSRIKSARRAQSGTGGPSERRFQGP